MPDKTPAEITPGDATDTSVVHASQDNSATMSRGHNERDISRLQSAVQAYTSKPYALGDLMRLLDAENFICTTAILSGESYDPTKWDPVRSNIQTGVITTGISVDVSNVLQVEATKGFIVNNDNVEKPVAEEVNENAKSFSPSGNSLQSVVIRMNSSGVISIISAEDQRDTTHKDFLVLGYATMLGDLFIGAKLSPDPLSQNPIPSRYDNLLKGAGIYPGGIISPGTTGLTINVTKGNIQFPGIGYQFDKNRADSFDFVVQTPIVNTAWIEIFATGDGLDETNLNFGAISLSNELDVSKYNVGGNSLIDIPTINTALTDFIITSGGTGYIDGETVDILGLTSTADNAVATVKVTAGVITAIVLSDGGSGYIDGESLSILGITSLSTNASVTGINSNGGQFQIFRIYQSDVFTNVFHGRDLYETIAEAKSQLDNDTYIERSATKLGAFRGYVITNATITDWSGISGEDFLFIAKPQELTPEDRGNPQNRILGFTQDQLNAAEAVQSTGVIEGGNVTINNGSPTDTIDIEAGQGVIIDHTSMPFPVTQVSWDAETFVLDSGDLASSTIYVLKNESGTTIIISTSDTKLSPLEDREFIKLAVIRTTFGLGADEIRGLENLKVPVTAPVLSLKDSLAVVFRTFSGLSVTENLPASTYEMDMASGTIFALGLNSVVTQNSPNVFSASPQASFQFRLVTDDGETTGTLTKDVDQGQFFDGTLQSVGVNLFTVKRLWFAPESNIYFLQYGTRTYTSSQIDETLYTTEVPATPALLSEFAYVIASLITRGGGSNWDDGAQRIDTGDITAGTSTGGSSGGSASDTPWSVEHDAAGFNLKSDTLNAAQTGFLRMIVNRSIAWRNNTNAFDFSFFAGSNDAFKFSSPSNSTFPRTRVDMESNATAVLNQAISSFLYRGKNGAGSLVTYAAINVLTAGISDSDEEGQVDFKTMENGVNVDYIQLNKLASNEIDLNKDVNFSGKVNKIRLSNSAKTINASGEITKTGSYHQVFTNGGASIDDLDTINGGQEGDILILQAATDSETVSVTENGNIKLSSVGTPFNLNNRHDTITLLFDASNWLEISRSDNSP